MKSIITLLMLTLCSASALDWTYSTNLYYALNYPTNIYMGTNASDGATNGDTFYQWGAKINAFMNLSQQRYVASSTEHTNNSSVGGVGLTNGTVFANRVQATNLWLTVPRWTDALAGGLTLAGGTTAPERADLPGSGWVTPGQAYRYGHDDYASFEIQSWHVMASTNSTFPNLYYEPHIHISVADLSAGTNATFVLEWQTAHVNQGFTNLTIRTNTYGFSRTNEHDILSFGTVTNNDLNARGSVMFRGSVKRIASASNDVGSGIAPNQSRKVFVDSLDFHIPIRVLGSSSQYTDE